MAHLETLISTLDKAEKAHFDSIRQQLEDANAWHSIDTRAAVLAAQLSAEVDQLQAAVKRNGLTYVTEMKNGATMHRKNPEHTLLQESRSRLFSVLKELGMTAGSRSRLRMDAGADAETDVIAELRAQLD
jgi:P27 family predicted phage terminase small subunit